MDSLKFVQGVDKMENPLQYVAMIKWRAGPPEYFQSFLEYCYKSLDV